jgi:hypothetical protein
MTDTAAPAPVAPAPASSESASEADLFAKYTDQHQAAVAAELGGDDASNDSRPATAAGQRPALAVAGRAATARAAEPRSGAADAGAQRPARGAGGEAADDAGAATSTDADPADPDGGDPAARKADDPPPEAPLSEADAIALARKAHADGDTEALDRALKAILPGSKGLSEFAVDGKRYAELRLVTGKERKKLDARAAELDGREHNVQRGIAMVEQLVARYQPFEQLVQALDKDDAEGFAEQFQKITKRSLNDILRRDLDKKLGKKTDPEVEALKQELRAEREARERREAEERAAREHRARAEQIQGHLNFIVETLGNHSDARVSALANTNEGLREIFLEQKAAFDPRTRQTITPEVAARRVIERKAKELEPWQRVLGGAPRQLPAASAAAPTSSAPPSSAPAPARATPLGSSGAAPASGAGRKLSDPELFEKYERLAKLAGD